MKKVISILMVIIVAGLFSSCAVANTNTTTTTTTKQETTGNAAETTTKTAKTTTTKATTQKTLYYPTEDEFMGLFNEEFPIADSCNKTYDTKTNSISITASYNYLIFNYVLFENEDGRITKCVTTVRGDYSREKSFESVFYTASSQVKYYIYAMATQPSYILACLMSEKEHDMDYFTSNVVKKAMEGRSTYIYDCEFSFSIADNRTCMTGFLNWDGEKE